MSARRAPEELFEGIASAEEAGELLGVVAAGQPARFEPEDIAVGEGAGWVMAAFLQGGAARFNDVSFGAFYAAREEATAIAETHFHYARFLAAAREEYALIGVRLLLADVAARATDIRGSESALPELYDPDPSRYARSQQWAAAQRAMGADGIVYDSVRRKGGECIAIFRPRLIERCRVGDRLAYEWNGRAIAATYQLTPRDVPYKVPDKT
ncbi:MAG TPA: RES family NAD+ phosphorylase [Gemmatimonadaceae bacterium]|nr:RES family NAD+ phosphorylase [Gemmatimonadaceae bacterium]